MVPQIHKGQVVCWVEGLAHVVCFWCQTLTLNLNLTAQNPKPKLKKERNSAHIHCYGYQGVLLSQVKLYPSDALLFQGSLC